MNDIVIIGAGGFAREVAWLIKDINTQDISRILKNIMISENERERMIKKGRDLVDGEGCNRIIRSMREVM